MTMPPVPLSEVDRRQFLILTLQLLAWASIPGCRSSLPVFGKDPISNAVVVEDHSQTLAYWAKRGIRDAVLINIDAHDDIRWIADAKIEELQNIYRRKDWQRFAEADSLGDHGLYNIGNWMYAGARLGMFREIYWVFPFRHFSQPDSTRELRQFLEHAKFSPDDIQTYKLHNNRFRGTYRGIPLTICGVESLPDINRPLLLSIDADFFPMRAEEYQEEFLAAVHTTFTALYRKNYQIQDAAICYSVNGGFVDPQLRWIGETVVALLARPRQLSEPPPPFLSLLQEIDAAYRTNNPALMLALMDSDQSSSQEPSLLLYNACAHYLTGDFEKAYAAATACCRQDKLYCSGLPYLGLLYYAAGKYQQAEKFFRAGYYANPQMRDGLYVYANCLRKIGKLREAIAFYEKNVLLNGSFPTQFLIVETYLMLGDNKAAAIALNAAMVGLENDYYATVANKTVADSLYSTLDFCDKNGHKKIATGLRNNPAIKQMFRKFPRH